MTLPSNSSMDCHPENTGSQFKTVLAQPVELKGDWEVALSEIHIPGKWYNVTGSQHWFEINGRRIEMTDGYYATVLSVLRKMIELLRGRRRYADADSKEINRRLTSNVINAYALSTKILLVYVIPSNRVVFVLPADVTMTLSPLLMDVLGFQTFKQPDDLTTASAVMIGQNEPGLRRYPIMAYVYCDLIEPVFVGDTKVPLLRTMNVYRGIPERIYNTPIYAPLQKKNFATVEVNIMGDTGEPVSFAPGKSVVVLHFRRTSNPYFL